MKKHKRTVTKTPRGSASKRKKAGTKPTKGFIWAPGRKEMEEAARKHMRSKELVFPKDSEDVLETARGMFPDLDIRLK